MKSILEKINESTKVNSTIIFDIDLDKNEVKQYSDDEEYGLPLEQLKSNFENELKFGQMLNKLKGGKCVVIDKHVYHDMVAKNMK